MVLNNALCIEILMIYWIINLHNHMHFVRYLDVFTIHSGVSIPLIVLIHICFLISLQKSLFQSMAIFLSYVVPYMLIIIIVVSTSLNEEGS